MTLKVSQINPVEEEFAHNVSIKGEEQNETYHAIDYCLIHGIISDGGSARSHDTLLILKYGDIVSLGIGLCCICSDTFSHIATY